MAEPLLRVEGVSKRFGGLLAVDNASFVVEPGRITALIGPNGAGKTTLFSIISGFLVPSAGRIFHRGTDITGTAKLGNAQDGIREPRRLTLPRRSQARSALAISSAGRRRASPSRAASGWNSHGRSQLIPNCFCSTRC